MRVKYEKISTIGLGDNAVTTIEEVSKLDATHKHICYHDEENPRSCKREKL